MPESLTCAPEVGRALRARRLRQARLTARSESAPYLPVHGEDAVDWRGEGLPVPIQLHEEGDTITLTPTLSHRMGEGDAPRRTNTHFGGLCRRRVACHDYCRRRGFSLIEMVGVLAIISLLAVAVISQVIKRIDRAAWEKEKLDQQAIADAYTQYILRNKSITNYPGIPSAIAKQMALPLSGINQTPRGWNRAFLVDPNFTIGGGKSYTQTSSGTVQPANARVMILASIAGNLPTGVVSSDNNSDFQAIWDTADGAKPSASTWTTWSGKGEDLLIKKLDLNPLFYQLILVDHDGANQATFAIDGTTAMTVASGGQGTQAYYLDGTVLGLYDCAAVNFQTRYLLQRSISFIFESCAWRGQIQGSGIQTVTNTSSVTATNFATRANTFYNEPTSPGGVASQTSVLVAMYTFMFDYVFWATECPRFDNHGNSNIKSVPEYNMLNDMGRTASPGSGGIDAFSGTKGLLK